MDNNSNTNTPAEEQGIDFGKILGDLKKHRRLYWWVLPITFIVVAVISLGLPNYYSCTVTLAPELAGKSGSSGLKSIASSFGISLGNSGGEGVDAINPTLYPDLVNSTDFRTSLFDVEVPLSGEEGGVTVSYYDYLLHRQKMPWWSRALRAVSGLFTAGAEDEDAAAPLDPFRLTMEQTEIVRVIGDNVSCAVDKKTFVISIGVTDQDPLVCATMADTVTKRLQGFITDYRTSKARVDLEYNEKLYEEVKVDYEEALKRYASFADANQAVVLARVQSRQTALENELQLQYGIYTQAAAQLQAARAKVQEEKPAFTTLQRATVPVLKAGPSRSKIVLIWVFLAFLVTTGYILYKEDDLKPLLGLSS